MSLLFAEETELLKTKIEHPRLGFLGLGWIGRARMESILQSGCVEVAALADASQEVVDASARIAPAAATVSSLDDLLSMDLDGIVIATPSALHASQAIAALEKGMAVFCQKPLARNRAETLRVIDAARAADKLLGIDLSYRYMTGVRKMRQVIQSAELGKIFAVDLVFHNAYGPDKSWFYDAKLSGGGCVIDLGIHLVDLALWCLNFPKVESVSSRLFSRGEPIESPIDRVEDFASACFTLETGTAVQISCSWKLPAGCDAIIRASFYGTEGGVEVRNVNGSFFDFIAERFSGTKREPLHTAPETWGGRAAVDWARRLAQGAKYDRKVERLADVAGVLDRIYDPRP